MWRTLRPRALAQIRKRENRSDRVTVTDALVYTSSRGFWRKVGTASSRYLGSGKYHQEAATGEARCNVHVVARRSTEREKIPGWTCRTDKCSNVQGRYTARRTTHGFISKSALMTRQTDADSNYISYRLLGRSKGRSAMYTRYKVTRARFAGDSSQDPVLW